MLRSGFGYSVNKERVSGIPKASTYQRAATVVINGLNPPGVKYHKRPIVLMLYLRLYLLLSNSPRRNSSSTINVDEPVRPWDTPLAGR